MSLKPVIGVPACRKPIHGQPFHAVGEKYLAALIDGAGALPLIIPVMADHLEGDFSTRLGERDALIGLMADKVHLGQFLDHPRDGCGRDLQPLGHGIGGDPVLLTLDFENRFQVVFDSLGVHFGESSAEIRQS